LITEGILAGRNGESQRWYTHRRALRIHLLSLIGAILILSIVVTQPVLPLYLQARGLPTAEVGLVIGLMSLSLIVTELGAMVVSRRLGRRRAVLLGSLGAAAMQFWFFWAATRPDGI
jgi:PPP family 3-phenylpropionic acid transporter